MVDTARFPFDEVDIVESMTWVSVCRRGGRVVEAASLPSGGAVIMESRTSVSVCRRGGRVVEAMSFPFDEVATGEVTGTSDVATTLIELIIA